MGNTPSGQRPPKVTAQDRAILQLKLQRDKLRKATVKIQVIINKENQIARQSVHEGNKRRAMLALKKRKYQENLLDTIEKQSDSLETLISTIEFKLIEKDVVFGLEEGNRVLKQINGELSMEKVDKIMDDSAEGIQYQEELSERLGELMPRALDDEVDEEMAKMEREEMDKEKEKNPGIPEVSTLPELPEAPRTEIKNHPKKGEREEQKAEPLPA
ncbi:DEKNAAC101342 [Brettanomyces naardenensis]|uniref:DEKNAAC101342 n=1 Tax=Brettanomyces naardenensis TaxID=13370 RepID=A0A448YHQ9_BRENA|nr:DEKNAAC101342 [Brettanomyces naardenensis]